MAVTYTTAAKVQAELQMEAAFSDATLPTTAQVERFINQFETWIDNQTNHAWRTVSVAEEYHDIIQKYNEFDGVIKLSHRKITTLASGTDKLEIWNGSEWEEYVANKTEGRGDDYWVDKTNGLIYIHAVSYFDNSARVTYRYGEGSVPFDIELLCTMCVARKIYNGYPEGLNTNVQDYKVLNWKKDIQEIIDRYKEVMII